MMVYWYGLSIMLTGATQWRREYMREGKSHGYRETKTGLFVHPDFYV